MRTVELVSTAAAIVGAIATIVAARRTRLGKTPAERQRFNEDQSQ
jgi:hypothetical protein